MSTTVSILPDTLANSINSGIDVTKINKADFDLSTLVDQVSKTVVDANDSFNFLSTVSNHVNQYSELDMASIQKEVVVFSLSTQLVSKTVSTAVKDIDSLIRMQ